MKGLEIYSFFIITCQVIIYFFITDTFKGCVIIMTNKVPIVSGFLS